MQKDQAPKVFAAPKFMEVHIIIKIDKNSLSILTQNGQTKKGRSGPPKLVHNIGLKFVHFINKSLAFAQTAL